MATKKVKLFIVEGPSEETAFALIFQRLFSNDSVWFDVVHGDVTTNLNGKPARDALREQVIEHVAKQQAYNWTDVAEIVHIVDIDGAFVPDEVVAESSDEEGLVYYEDHIEALNRTHIIRRNHEKAAALRQLCLNNKITYKRRSVPYKVYYLSRNMEHALYGKIGNLANRQKENLARVSAQIQRRP